MTYFPNVREKVLFGKENGYCEGKLNAENKEFVQGFDWAVEKAENFFDNQMEDDGRLIDQIKNEIIEELKDDFIRRIESERNELIVSMLDNQYDEEEMNQDEEQGDDQGED